MENNNWPETAKEFIEYNSFIENGETDAGDANIGDGTHMHAGERVIPVVCVEQMISHYFNTKSTANDLSAEDFVKAININLDALTSSIKEKEDTTSIMTSMMLEYTKNFINEFVETAVVKTEDEEQEETIEENAFIIPSVLDQTIDLMTSSDYKNRFKAEYYQLHIRLMALDNMLRRWDTGQLDFTPDCPRSIYALQYRVMDDYITVLEARAKIEGIEL